MKKRKLLLPGFVAFLALLLLSLTAGKPSAHRHSLTIDTLPLIAAKAKDHKGQSITSRQGVVSFTSGLDNDFYQVDSPGKTGFLYVETRMAAHEAIIPEQDQRVPLNICIVIDRSGSMNGVKLGFAKKAAKGIVERLQSSDMVSVVMYDNAIDSVQAPVHVMDKESIYKKIDAITSRGGTNLWGGTEKGYEYVMKNYRSGNINRVLLISDGLANVGLTDPKLIHLKVQQYKDDQGVTLSTFGVGLDYNETLMTDMAETGLGNYYFIDAPDKMTAMFDKELNGLMRVAAQDAQIRIKIPQGVTITKSYPLSYTNSGDEVVIRLRDLFSEETRGTLFSFSIANGTQTPLKLVSSLSYTDIRDGLPKVIQHDHIISPVRNVDAYLTHFNKSVIEQAILYTANENLEKAMAEMDRGDFASANGYIDANRRYLASNVKYVQLSKDLRKMDSTNNGYGQDISRVRRMGGDSLKRVQKKSREMNYFLRQKKQ